MLLPPASLFDQSNVSSVWMEVVERTSKFLRSVVMGDLSTDPGAVEIPSKDKNTALTLLLGMVAIVSIKMSITTFLGHNYAQVLFT